LDETAARARLRGTQTRQEVQALLLEAMLRVKLLWLKPRMRREQMALTTNQQG
jgi:hypothetical protein